MANIDDWVISNIQNWYSQYIYLIGSNGNITESLLPNGTARVCCNSME